MDSSDIYDPQELGRRQRMAAARRRRESARLALLAQLLDAQRQADALKAWISAYAQQDRADVHPELRRMAGWATAQLGERERKLNPERISETLRAQDLFPEVDPLDDPKGEPPRHRIWGGSSALRHINAV